MSRKHELSDALAEAMLLNKQEATGNQKQQLSNKQQQIHRHEKEMREHPEAAQTYNDSSATLEALLLQTVPRYNNDRFMVTPAAREQNHEASAILKNIAGARNLLARKPQVAFDAASCNPLFAQLLALQPLVSRPHNWSWPPLPNQSWPHASQHHLAATAMPCATSFTRTSFVQSSNNQEESTLAANVRDTLLLAKESVSPLHQLSLPSYSSITSHTPINGNASLHRAQNPALGRLLIPGVFGTTSARAPAQFHLAEDQDCSSCITTGRPISTMPVSDPSCLLLESAASMATRVLPIVKDQEPYTAPIFGGAESFPMILHRALAELELVNGGEHIATFLPDGKAFQIRDQMRFELQVLPLFFPKMKAFGSFQRQLNLYNFYRVSDSRASRGTYSHPLFLRDFPILSSRMKRTKIKGGPARGPPRMKKGEKKVDDKQSSD